MLKKIFICILTVATAFTLCSCSNGTDTPSESYSDISLSGTDRTMPDEQSQENAVRYSTSFDENETFADSTLQQAAEIIDPYIKQAVTLMNTIREDEYLYTALKCDYSRRKKARDTITDPLALQMYDIMVQKTFAFEDFCFDNSFAPGDLFNCAVTANDAVRLDHPYLLLYCDMKISGNTFSSAYYLPGDWISTPCSDREKVKTEVRLFDCIVSRIIEKMPQNLTDWEKCQYFAFVITCAVEYDDSFETMGNNFQAYDALVNGTALCEGYAQAFYYLCQQQDIACWYCLGQAPYELGYHAWNMVETEQGPVYMDITWYDEDDITDSYRDGKTCYLFMNQEDYDWYGYVETGRR